VALLNEEDDEEDLDEEDLDIGTEIDPDSPPWDIMYAEQDMDDNDDSNEDTALLRSKAARIVITPISPVNISSIFFLIKHKITINLIVN
jgi:hypothetical protein